MFLTSFFYSDSCYYFTKENIPKELSKNPYTNYGFYKWVGDNVMMTECRVFSDDDITLIISLHTKKYVVRLNESKSKSRI